MDIEFLDDKIENFLGSLEKTTVAKVLHMLELLENFGHLLGMPQSKKVIEGLFELRIRGKQEVRLLYTFYKGRGIILHGFVKKSQKIPQKEILLAKQKLKSLDNI